MKPSIQTPFTPRQYMLSQDFEIYYYSDTRHNNVDLHTHAYYEFYFYMAISIWKVTSNSRSVTAGRP